jgi:LmbE family N-acetylglucosaminyl deacetylase
VRAAELAGTPRVYEATMNRDRFRAMFEAAREGSLDADLPEGMPEDLPEVATMGTPEAQLTTCVDVREHLTTKRMAMRAHASQIGETSFFLTMPEEVFAEAFGTEWFVRRGVATPVDAMETSLLDGLEA